MILDSTLAPEMQSATMNHVDIDVNANVDSWTDHQILLNVEESANHLHHQLHRHVIHVKIQKETIAIQLEHVVPLVRKVILVNVLLDMLIDHPIPSQNQEDFVYSRSQYAWILSKMIVTLLQFVVK